MVFVGRLFAEMEVDRHLPSLVRRVLVTFRVACVVIVFDYAAAVLDVEVPSVAVSYCHLIDVFGSRSDVVRVVADVRVFVSFTNGIRARLRFVVGVCFSLFAFFHFGRSGAPVDADAVSDHQYDVLRGLSEFCVQKIGVYRVVARCSVGGGWYNAVVPHGYYSPARDCVE